MNKTTEALKLAEEALESCDSGDYSTGHVIHPSFNDKAVDKALAAIREALAEPDAFATSGKPIAEPVKQEPVAHYKDAPHTIYLQTGCDDPDPVNCECAFNEWGDTTWCKDQIHDTDIPYIRADYAAPVQPVKQEPVGWVMTNGVFTEDSFKAKIDSDALPVYREPVDAKAIRAEALEEAAKVLDEWDNARDALDVYHRIAAAIRGLK